MKRSNFDLFEVGAFRILVVDYGLKLRRFGFVPLKTSCTTITLMRHVTDEPVFVQHGIPRRPNGNPAVPNPELADEAGNKPNTDHRTDLLVTIPNINQRYFLDVSIAHPSIARFPNAKHTAHLAAVDRKNEETAHYQAN